MKSPDESKLRSFYVGERTPNGFTIFSGRTILETIAVFNYFFNFFDREERMRIFLHARSY